MAGRYWKHHQREVPVLMKLKACGLVAAYLVVSFFNFGAINGHWRGEFPGSHTRVDAGMCMGYAIIPVIGTAVAIFGTGFFEYGFSWRIDNGCSLCGGGR